MATLQSTRGDALAAIDTEARQCVHALEVDDVRYDRGQAALAAMSHGAVYVPPLDDPTEPIRMRLLIDDVLSVDGSCLDSLIAWYSNGLSALLALKHGRKAVA